MAPRRRRPRTNRHFKIDHVLPLSDRDTYLTFLRDPRTTVDTAHAWLAERGYCDFSRSAVARHKRHYLEHLLEHRKAMDLARQYAVMAEGGQIGAMGLSAGAVLRVEHLLFGALFDPALDGATMPLEKLTAYGDLVGRTVKVRQQMVELEQRLEAARALGKGNGKDAAAPLTPRQKEQQEQETLREICQILDCLPRETTAKPP